MRRFTVLAAGMIALVTSIASADPFDQLSSRLKQYDDSAPRTAQPQNTKATLASQPSSVDQSRGPASSGTWQDDWDHEGPWEEPCYGPGCDECANDPCCNGCGIYARAEYLYWWVRGSSTPPLITTSPDNTPRVNAGILPEATVLFGGERLNTSGRSGGRFTLGYWLDPYQTVGIESSTLFLGSNTQKFVASSGGNPILAQPFYNVLTNTQDAHLLAYPDFVIGTANIYSTSRVVGTELNLRRGLYTDCCHRIDVIAGWRFLQLSEGLSIATNATSIAQDIRTPVGTNFGILDRFTTRNNFNGGQIGLNSQHTNGCWTLDLLAKVAIGGVAQSVGIQGSTTVAQPNEASTTSSGGILALGSNIGSYHRSRFAALPEFGATLRYQINPIWRVNVGYTLLILNNVVRPGDQIDTRLDPNQFPPPLPGPATYPKFIFNDSDLWIQGVNIGVEACF
jgi:hypothetical protein